MQCAEQATFKRLLWERPSIYFVSSLSCFSLHLLELLYKGEKRKDSSLHVVTCCTRLRLNTLMRLNHRSKSYARNTFIIRWQIEPLQPVEKDCAELHYVKHLWSWSIQKAFSVPWPFPCAFSYLKDLFKATVLCLYCITLSKTCLLSYTQGVWILSLSLGVNSMKRPLVLCVSFYWKAWGTAQTMQQPPGDLLKGSSGLQTL